MMKKENASKTEIETYEDKHDKGCSQVGTSGHPHTDKAVVFTCHHIPQVTYRINRSQLTHTDKAVVFTSHNIPQVTYGINRSQLTPITYPFSFTPCLFIYLSVSFTSVILISV